MRTCIEVGRFCQASHWFASPERAGGGGGGNPWYIAFWGQGAFLGRSRELGGPAGCCGTVAASRSPVTHSPWAGEGGLPGSRDEDAQPGRLGSSLVTRDPVCCKQSRGQREKKGRRGPENLPPAQFTNP